MKDNLYSSHRLLGFFLTAAVTFGLLSCASKQTPSTPEAVSSEEASTGLNELVSIQIQEGEQGATVTLEGSAPMAPNIFKLGDPDRIIVDLTDTKLGSVESAMEVGKGGIAQITANQFDDANSSLSRVVIELSEPAEYQAESQDNSLALKIAGGAGELPLESEEPGLPDVPAMARAEEEIPIEEAIIGDPFAQVDEPLDLDLEPQLQPTPVEEVATEPVEEAAEEALEEAPAVAPVDTAALTEDVSTTATELVDIQYSSSDTGTMIRFITNGNVEQYEDFVLQDPQRVVIDLNGFRNAYPGDSTVSLGTSEVASIRIGESDNNVRLVLDVPATTSPAYTVSRDGNALVLNLAAVASSEEVPLAEAEPLPLASEPVVEEALEPTPDVPAAPVAGSPVVITGFGFKQMKAQNKSRLIINLNQPTEDYSLREEGTNRFVVTIGNSNLEREILKREFDTREFQTAILSVAPRENQTEGTTEFVVELEQQVSYNISQEESNLFVDVEIPSQILRKQTPTLASTEDAAPTLPPEDTSEKPSLEAEVGLDSQDTTQASQPSSPPKDYRYVREEFMSDTVISGEPLTRMGAILSGQIEGKSFVGRKISLDFKDAEVRSIFRLLADISKFNMIISDDVSGRITIRLDDVPWDQAFAIILQTRGLWFERYGNIVRIAPADKLRRERELAAAAARAAQAAKPLDVLFKPVSFAEASTLIKQIGSVLSDRGSVDIDSRTNTLIIKDIRENLEKARRMVDILDTQTPQVTIESRIVEATTTFTRSFGITWSGNTRFSAATGNPTGLFFPNSVNVPFAMNFPVEAGFINSTATLQMGSINNVLDLDLALALGEQEGHSKLISAPKVTVLDNSSATISAGSRIPFLTQTANAGSNVRFENAATTLSVTPHITNDGSILMQITATRNQPNFAQLVQGNPLIDQRTATTEVLVKSGNTTVLGGIYSTQSGRSQSRFPYLSKIPILGALFRNYDKQLRRTELLVFVTPRIVGDEREAVRDVRQ